MNNVNMLSAFAPRPIVEFKQRDKSKIESVLSHGDRVFVGLNTGSLRIYTIKESSANDNVDDNDPSDGGVSSKERGQSSNTHLAELRREVEKFSRKPIQQLAIINDASILVSLSDGYVSFHELETYNLSQRLDVTKGASLFATTRNIVNDPETGIPSIVSRLAVAIRRKLIIWTWQDMELVENLQQFTVAAAVKSLTWASNFRVAIGMDPGFSMVDIETGDISDVNRATDSTEASGPAATRFGAVNASGMGYMGMGSYLPKPMATKLSDDEILLAKDVNTLFIDLSGSPLDKRQVPWVTTPEAIGYSYPYLLSLQQPSKGQLDLRNPDTLSLLQTISLPNASFLHVPHPNISLAHAGKGFLVSSERCIWRMDAIEYGPQIDELLQQAQFDEALSLVNLIEDTLLLDKNERILTIKVRKAYALFEKRSYPEALELFSEAGARPSIVIALYPESIAGDLSSYTSPSKTHPPGSTGQRSSESQSLGRKASKDLSHKKRISDTMSIRSNISVSKDDSAPVRSKQLEGKDLTIAVKELIAFLTHTRGQLQKYINFDGTLKRPLTPAGSESELPPFAHLVQLQDQSDVTDWQDKLFKTAKLVDTTLFRAFMLINPSLIGSLFRIDNFCSADVVEEKLYENGRYSEIIDFLHGKDLHEEALKILERLGKEPADGETTVGFRGPARTIKYLQQLSFELVDLIIYYAEWPLRENPDEGMDIFLADTNNAEKLPRQRVLDFLQSINPNLTARYLEHIVDELHDKTPAFLDQLARLYLGRIKGKSKDQQAIPDQEKLERLLKDSGQYNKAALLKQMPIDDEIFFESRAIILRKLSRHKEALQIYVYHMKDYKKAEEYCNQVYYAATSSSSFKVDPDDTDSIYTILLSLYLKPTSPYAPNIDAALKLLSVHGSRLPALATLSALPSELPIRDLENYFRTRMRAANSIAREEAIVASLRSVEKTTSESDLLLGRDWDSRDAKTGTRSGKNRRVVLNEDMLCHVCNKRSGKAAARLWPDGRVAHYGCSDRVGRSGL